MPEGPSIIILKEAVKSFKGKKITGVSGSTKKIDIQRLLHREIKSFKSWGKHFLICFNDFTIRIHFMLFGSYRINEQREMVPRLHIQFKSGEINFYACSIKIIEEDLNEVYDWSSDVMNRKWNPAEALKKIKSMASRPVCDALLDQNIFAGVGNIIKNEVLYRIKIHPLSETHKLPERRLKELIAEARKYSFDFLKWKKKFELKKHWLVHTKKICPGCNTPLIKKHLGKTNRRSFYCDNCQVLYI